MYLSLESMLCFFWLFLFLFYTQCMYYLCFLGVHWLKRICYIKGYIILCMIPYLLLTMATFNRLHLLFHVLCYKTRKKKVTTRKTFVFVSAHSGYGHKYEVQFVFFFFSFFF